MSIAIGSLMDPSIEPSLQSSLDWVTGTLLGSVAIAISVIAVASLGFIMLTGRLPIRRGIQSIIGCFVLFGAPAIAATFTGFWQGSVSELPQVSIAENSELSTPRDDLPPAQYDPYAGASLRSD